jgi:SAM-dependent methyltransferase
MNKKTEKERTIEFFTQKVLEHGGGYAAANWGSPEGQSLRFQVLTEISDLDGRSVLDIGCGCGHLLEYLEKQSITVSYKGWDITPSMIRIAKEKYNRDCFEERDIMAGQPPKEPEFDFVFASGIFYLLRESPYDHIKKMVARMLAHARLGVAFNTLSQKAPTKDKDEFYADPVRILSDCFSLAPRFVIRHDYLKHDFTVYLLKEEIP